MNFLAHAYLSKDDDEILTGNIIADFVKGSRLEIYSEGIRKGIFLHRSIDTFTDSHPLIRSCRKIFYPVCGHYAMVVVDVVLDHFLGKDWQKYHAMPLKDFTSKVYRVLHTYETIFPGRFQLVYPRMVQYDWLASYASIEGLERSFQGLSHRSPAFRFTKQTMEQFHLNNTELQQTFDTFFPELVKAVN